MSWLKKTQTMQLKIVTDILNNNLDGSIEDIQAKLESSVPNPCNALSQICDGKIVPPFYMTVWSALCSQAKMENETEI